MVRRGLRFLGVLGTVVALAGCWPAPGQGPDRTGHNPFETALSPANVATLTEEWSVSPGFGSAAPVTSGATVYVVANASGGVQGNVVTINAYDVRDGAERFTATVADIPVQVLPSPAWLVDGRVATGWSYTQRRPVVVLHSAPSVDAGTGAPAGEVGSGPVETVRGDVVVTTATSPVGPSRDVRQISVTDLGDPGGSWGGALQYLEYLPFPGSGGIGGGLTLGAERLLHAGPGPAGTTPGSGYGTGVRAYPIAGVAQGCGPDGVSLVCPAWVTALPGSLTTPVLAPDQSTIYVVANESAGGTTSGTLYALDAATGAVLWSTAVGARGWVPALADGIVYVPAGDGRVLALAAEGCGAATCDPLWEAVTGTGSSLGQPAVAGGVVFTDSADGTVHAFAAAGCGAASCDPLWDAEPPTEVSVTGLAVSGGRLFVRTGDGKLTTYALP